MKRLAAVFAFVLVTTGAAATAAPQIPSSHQLQFATVVENGIWVESYAEADLKAQAIASAGFNSVRIFVPYSPGQAEIDYDAQRLCNAAQSARDSGLKLIVSIYGVDGYVPLGWAQVDRFIKTVNDHLYWLFGQNGCTKDVQEFTIEIFNEVNTKRWWVDPDRYVRILDRVYPAIKAEAAKLGVQATLMAGALASNHDPLGYISQMGDEMKTLGVTTPLFDIFTYHPYPASSSESPAVFHASGNLVGVADYSQLAKTLKKAFGYLPLIFYDEYGIETDIPKSQLRHYWGKSPTLVQPVPETTQAQFYAKALGLAGSQRNVIGLAIFHLVDDPQLEQWQSGLYYADDFNSKTPLVPKSSLPAVALAVQGALAP